MRTLLCSFVIGTGLLLSAHAFAANETPVGTWTQVDDATAKPKSIIEVSEAPDDTLQAVVKQVLFSDQGPHPICQKCEGARHNQPVEGMTIMWGVKHNGDQWDGGQILDPQSGKTYKVKLKLTDGGQKLEVRGYMGMSLFGRSQTWLRKQ